MIGKEKGVYEWVVEFVILFNVSGEFMQVFDRSLWEINFDYDVKCNNNMVLEFLMFYILEEGGFDCWLKLVGKLGGQYKVFRLSNNCDIVE